MNKKSAAKANAPRKRAASGWSIESDGQDKWRSYITVDEFWARMHLMGFRQLQIAGSDEAIQSIQALLKDQTRIYAIEAGNASNFRTEYTSVRSILRAMKVPTQHFLDQARTGFEELDAAFMSADGYWLHPGKIYVVPLKYENSTLSEALSVADEFDVRYLDWMCRLRDEKTPLFQQKLAAFLFKELQLKRKACDPDFQLLRRQFGDDEVEIPNGMEKALASLELLRKNSKHEIEFIAESRDTFEWRTWPWNDYIDDHPVKYATLSIAWPFPPVFLGDESSDELLLAALNCDAVGSWMESTFERVSVNLFHGDNESDETYGPRNKAFHELIDQAKAKIHMAGTFLRLQALMVEVLATPTNEDVSRCDLCFRRVGKGKQKYCALHSINIANVSENETVSQRTRLRHSQSLANDYLKRSEALFNELSRNSFFRYPSVFFSSEVNLKGVRDLDPSDPESFVKELNIFVELLEPIVGTTLHDELVALADSLINAVYVAYKPYLLAHQELAKAENRLREEKVMLKRALDAKEANNVTKNPSVTSSQADLPNKDADFYEFNNETKCLNEAVKHYRGKVRQAELNFKENLEKLSVFRFLTEFFSRKFDGTEKLVDGRHPLAIQTDVRSKLKLAPAFDLNQIVREDFLALRAWYETHGRDVDKALTKVGEPLPVSRKVRKFDWKLMLECIGNLRKVNPLRKPTAQEIAEAISMCSNPPIKLTRSAVSQVIRRAETTLDEIIARIDIEVA